MNTEEWAAQVNGTLEAVVLACTSMVATHPEKDKILVLLRALTAHANDTPGDSPVTLSYKAGIRTAVATIAEGVDTARQAEQIRSLGKQQGGH